MATQTIEFVYPSGETLTADIAASGTDTLSQTALSATERTNKKGFYTVSFTGTLEGLYDIVIKSGSTVVAVDSVKLLNATATYQVQSLLSFLDDTVSSRLPTSSYVAPATPTNVTDAQTAILAKLPSALVGGRIDASVGAMAANTLTASALATDAVTEIQSGLATSSLLSNVDANVTDIMASVGQGNAILDKFETMIVLDGAVYQYTANALELGPSGGGSNSVTVTPTQAALTDNEAVDGTLIQAYYNAEPSLAIGVVDAAGDEVTLTGKTLRFVVENRFGVDVEVVENADITKSGNTATLSISTDTTGTAGQYKWALRDVNNGNNRLGHGILEVLYIPDKDV